MKIVKILMCFLFAYLTIGCSCQKPATRSYYGAIIQQNDAQEMAKRYLNGILYDPYSARCRFGTIYKGYLQTTPSTGCKVYFGYILNVGVNAKNRYGGYVGEKLYRFVFYNRQLIYVSSPK